MRQGCPLSPLVFILAFDPLSHMLTTAMERGTLRGVEFPELGLVTILSMYADDVAVMLRAEIRYIMACKDILMRFGAVSGLHFIWNQTKAAYIPDGPPPSAFWLFPWTWEEISNASKYLGFPMASDFAVAQTERLLCTKIDNSLEKFRTRHLSLAGRIVVANSLILSTIWYIITLWARDQKFFTTLQSRIDSFVWAGRPRVNRNTTTLARHHGGLGLLLIEEQHRAIAGNLILWVLGPTSHPLRLILQSHIHEISEKKWGCKDLTWAVTMGGSRSSRGSAAWKNICKAWTKLKPLLLPVDPRNIEEWKQLPLWRPHRNHNNHSLVNCSTRARQWLRTHGINMMGDVISPTGQFVNWADIQPGNTNVSRERAFQKLIDNLLVIPTLDATPGLHRLFRSS